MQTYQLEDPEVSLQELSVIDALDSMHSQKVQIEFPERIWDAPVITGIGQRVQNPNWPKDSTQRYAFQGSPWDYRIPRMVNGVMIVKYMREKFEVKAFERTHKSGKKSLIFKAVEIDSAALFVGT